jgi:hypothetical protein
VFFAVKQTFKTASNAAGGEFVTKTIDYKLFTVITLSLFLDTTNRESTRAIVRIHTDRTASEVQPLRASIESGRRPIVAAHTPVDPRTGIIATAGGRQIQILAAVVAQNPQPVIVEIIRVILAFQNAQLILGWNPPTGRTWTLCVAFIP